MDVICFAIGVIIGLVLGAIAGYLFGRTPKKDLELERQEREATIRMKKEMANFYAYDGTTKGQEEISHE